MQNEDHSSQDFLTPSVSFKRWDYGDKPCPMVCRQALDGRLYSRGTDFTAWYINGGGRPGSSYMKRFWEQSLTEDDTQEHEGGSIWVLEEGAKPMGAVIFERCRSSPVTIGDRELHGRHANAKPSKTFQAQAVGRVAMWIDPSLRGRGLMKLLASNQVAPMLEGYARELQSQGFFPFIRASDASARILNSECDLPVPGFFRTCLNEKENLRSLMMTMGTEMHRHDRWGVKWVPSAPAQKSGLGPRR